MNVLLFSALSLVLARNYWEIPILRDPTEITIQARDGYNGITFIQESFYTEILIDGIPYTTHLEPESGDIWIIEVDGHKANTTRQTPVEVDIRTMNPLWDIGEYRFGRIGFHRNHHFRNHFFMPYAVLNTKLKLNDTRTGGLGLAPTNFSTPKFPKANGENRDKYENFADRIKGSGLAQSDAFTINLATNASKEDKLVYGAMDTSRFTGKLKALYRSPSTGLIIPEFTINGVKTRASIAIEGPNTYLADEVVVAVASSLGAVWDPNYGLYVVYAMPQDDIIISFDGFEIIVPPSYVWVQVNDRWYFTIRPLSSHTSTPRAAIIGADILRSTYIVYDPRHNRAAIGQAKRNPGPPNYEVIPAEGIPEKYLY